MKIMATALTVVGHFAAVAAIACIGVYVYINFRGLVRHFKHGGWYEELPEIAGEYFWIGFLLLALWMACEVGRIGL